MNFWLYLACCCCFSDSMVNQSPSPKECHRWYWTFPLSHSLFNKCMSSSLCQWMCTVQFFVICLILCRSFCDFVYCTVDRNALWYCLAFFGSLKVLVGVHIWEWRGVFGLFREGKFLNGGCQVVWCAAGGWVWVRLDFDAMQYLIEVFFFI